MELQMGSVFVKSYFPEGYTEWVDKSTVDKINEPLTEELYEIWFKDDQKRKYIEDASKFYEENCQLIAKGQDGIDELLKKYSGSDISANRVVYDNAVCNEICKFWLLLIDIPIDQVQQFYSHNKPNVEKIFYDVETMYGLKDLGYPAAETIAIYKHYTC